MANVVRDFTNEAFGASLILGAENVYDCSKKLYHSPQNRLLVLQVIASIAQLGNQIFFVLLYTQSASTFFNNQCAFYSNLSDCFYYTYQVLSVAVLIQRATSLFPPKLVVPSQIFFYLTLAAGFALAMVSSVVKEASVSSDYCNISYGAYWNNIGKLIYFVLYSLLLLSFVVPAIRLTASRSESTGASTAGQLGTNRASDMAKILNKVVADFGFRVSLAIAGYLITVILSYAGVWGNFFFIQFTIQNYCGIMASTVVHEPAPRASGTLKTGTETKKIKPPSTLTSAVGTAGQQ